MKKVLLVLVLLVVTGIVVLIAACENPIDTVQSWINGDAQTTAAETSAPASETTVPAEETDKTTEEKIAEAGGNPEEETALVIDITINNSDYLYENHAKTLDDIKEIITSADGLSAVRITDENATQSAYKSLSDFLNEKGIEIINETVSE